LGKILFWALLIIGALLIARILAHQNTRTTAQPRRARQQPPPAVGDNPESMVRCAHCGIHLPRSDAVLLEGRTWCSSEHARLGQRQP